MDIRDESIIVKYFNEIHKEIRCAIKSLKSTKCGVSMELEPKQPSLDSLAKHTGFYVDDKGKQGGQDVKVNINIDYGSVDKKILVEYGMSEGVKEPTNPPKLPEES